MKFTQVIYGKEYIIYQGFRYDRGKILSKLEKQDVTGDVYFIYINTDTDFKKEVKTGI